MNGRSIEGGSCRHHSPLLTGVVALTLPHQAASHGRHSALSVAFSDVFANLGESSRAGPGVCFGQKSRPRCVPSTTAVLIYASILHTTGGMS